MKRFFKDLKIPVSVLVALGAIILLALAAIGYKYFVIKKESTTVLMDQYNSGNQILHDEVVRYLTKTLEPEEEQSEGVATVAVDNYETIVSSGITVLNRSHTDAVLQNVRKAILENISGADQMSTEELDLIAANITEMVLLNIMTQLEGLSADARSSKEFADLYKSLSNETAYLSDHEFKITITASINDAYIDSAVLFDAISNMTEEEKAYFAKQLEEIQGNVIKPELLEWLNQFLDEAGAGAKGVKGETGAQGAKGETGAQGIQGIRGERGEQGIQGEKGEQGVKGSDGYTPVKGLDYFTDDDVNSIVDKVTIQATTILQSTLGDQVTYIYDPESQILYINSVGSGSNPTEPTE